MSYRESVIERFVRAPLLEFMTDEPNYYREAKDYDRSPLTRDEAETLPTVPEVVTAMREYASTLLAKTHKQTSSMDIFQAGPADKGYRLAADMLVAGDLLTAAISLEEFDKTSDKYKGFGMSARETDYTHLLVTLVDYRRGYDLEAKGAVEGILDTEGYSMSPLHRYLKSNISWQRVIEHLPTRTRAPLQRATPSDLAA